jgi:hypothetical protein
MKKLVVLILCMLQLFSCKKKEADPEPQQPAAPSVGSLELHIVAYDSLGGTQQDGSKIKVELPQTGTSATTNSLGIVSFTGLPYGYYAPVLTKHGYEGAPALITLSATSQAVSMPIAQRSTYLINNFHGYVAGQDSINIVFTLDKAIAAGKFCRLAILTSTLSSFTPNNFMTADLVTTNVNSDTLNVAHLPALQASVANLPAGSPFYIGAVCVSYGLYESNQGEKAILLGDNLIFPANINFIKTW